ncbi:MAG TPA: CoB--CoM heterodisulfide reductase iron-sulfur subunit A family protein [Thermodesulfobacteriota bacterium]|nr:CoB--CoM heterodisulfide reductase iron-sulfur subunit A family protein [Thermodesulfobacteriota bacterium]
MSEKIGVYLCHCGSNIAGVVDVEEASFWAQETFPEVTVSRNYKFMCSSPGQELIEKDIKELGLTRVVVAACSPHLHEPTFRGACQRAGLNPFLFEMASIREQVSWVTTDKQIATQKAKALIEGAIKRVVYNEPLEPFIVKIDPNVLIVGGGVAGIQAALEIADSGSHVYLVEREPSIGGHMAQFDKTFPTLDCSACILTPKMFAVGSHPNITLLTWSEVEKVEGYVGNFTVQVRKRARKIKEDLCTGCLVCQEKCPKKVVDNVFEVGLANRKAVYVPFPQAVPKYPVIDTENCTFFQKGKCKICEHFCPTDAIDFAQEDQVLKLNIGNILLATGYDPFDCRRMPQYGYGVLPNVITSLEFERMTNASGPTAGKVLLKDGKTVPTSIGIIHCVGSRDKNYNEYCSSICCMQSLKFAHLAHEKTGAKVCNFYIDIRTPAKSYEEFYKRIQDEGTIFVRGKVGEVTNIARSAEEEGKLIVQVFDTLLGMQRRIPVDMVILSAALEPRADAKEVGKKFGISCAADGWLIERHPKLDPVATMTEGVYIAGCAQGPKDIPASVAQGAAAAARIIGRIQQGQMALEPVRANVIEDRCSACRTCNDLCPFSAITFDMDKEVSLVNPALCQGCGTCVAACPAGAIIGTHFSDEQIMAQIKGLLEVPFAPMQP